MPEALTFQSGTNEWTRSSKWPPNEVTPRDLYFHEGRELSFEKTPAVTSNEYESYLSDPAHPVPYRKRPIQATYGPDSTWYTWLVQDQRFLADRKDVLSWRTASLDHDLTIEGDVVAHIFAATTGTDMDLVVKLIDEYPDSMPRDPKMAGYQLMIVSEIFRGRYRQSFEEPTPIVPGSINEYAIDLHSNNYVFKKGHRLMVQVQSTWFPLYDRNPQTFVDNIFTAKPLDFVKTNQMIYQSPQYPSRLTLPVQGKIMAK